MLITIDVSHPENDIEIVGLGADETPETRFGPRAYIAYRLLTAAARLLFLASQKSDKPDIAAATTMQIEREAGFIRQRLDEINRPAGGRPKQKPGSRR